MVDPGSARDANHLKRSFAAGNDVAWSLACEAGSARLRYRHCWATWCRDWSSASRYSNIITTSTEVEDPPRAQSSRRWEEAGKWSDERR